MPKIRPISDLRNYADVVSEVRESEPVYLTKNGKGAFAVVDIKYTEQFDIMKKELEFLNFVLEGERSAEKNGWIDFESFKSNMEKLT